MTGAMSRRKGSTGELEFCRVLAAHGWPNAQRTADGRAQHERGDIAGGPAGFHLEVKRRERLEIVKWCYQAETEARPTDIPAVVFRTSRQPWRMVMLADDLLPVLALRDR